VQDVVGPLEVERAGEVGIRCAFFEKRSAAEARKATAAMMLPWIVK
jgi:hypothetical protein